MRKKLLPAILVVAVLAVIGAAAGFLSHVSIPVLQPAGTIGHQERNLMFFAAGLSLLIIIPVFTLTFYIVWKYRAGRGQIYKPDYDHNRAIEIGWWLIPGILLLIISVVNWQSTHKLDPFRPLASKQSPLVVQVVALDWKWLFIYPEQHVASVNWLEIPTNRPVHFYITADAPMNSFWIPQLGGQIYAMPGMSTELYLEASHNGDFYGSSANISGRGFANMHFTTRAVATHDFETWVNRVKQSPNSLTTASYTALAKPSLNQPISYYTADQPKLYDSIVMQYMEPGGLQ